MTVFCKSEANVREIVGASLPRQIELPLGVPVCAWCRPRESHADVGMISHGICLRHLREMKLSLRGALPPRRPHRRVAQGQPASGLMLLPL